MLDNKGFDLWADGYDRSVGVSDDDNTYPFAGYKKVLAAIYDAIRAGQGKRVLDIGFGTGVLACRLYEDGYDITGIDFSDRMIEIAREKMPSARLIRHDFSEGLPAQLRDEKFDSIICTYAIHHLDDAAKIGFMKELQTHLNPSGQIYIGDVAFATRQELEECRAQCGDAWDDEEFYVVAEKIAKEIPEVRFEKYSHCAGVLKFHSESRMVIREYKTYNEQEILPLYTSVGWTAYTDHPDVLRKGYENSMLTLAAYEGKNLLGIIRAVGDGHTIVFVQDILVFPEHQRKGIGSALMEAILDRYSHVRQIELATDNTPKTIAFYKSMGFREMSETGCCGFMKLRD